MAQANLLIGNKNYSSWSLRPWIAMKVAGIPFEDTVIPRDRSSPADRYRTPGECPILPRIY
jgi:glutathione S-transferase